MQKIEHPLKDTNLLPVILIMEQATNKRRGVEEKRETLKSLIYDLLS